MGVCCNRFPGGRRRALTFSYDDGRAYDRRLVELFNRHGLRATFHLNSGRLGDEGYVGEEEVARLYRGHEVAAHTVDHPHIYDLTPAAFCAQVLDDRRALEALAGTRVGGMSYPYGEHPRWARDLLPGLGIDYCRTVRSTRCFAPPDDLLLWHPTAHHREDIAALGAAFLEQAPRRDPALLFVWGHGQDLERENNWHLLEAFCEEMGGREDIWYATNAQVAAYLTALRGLRWSADGRRAHNPSALAVWVEVDGEPRPIEGGGQVALS